MYQKYFNGTSLPSLSFIAKILQIQPHNRLTDVTELRVASEISLFSFLFFPRPKLAMAVREFIYNICISVLIRNIIALFIFQVLQFPFPWGTTPSALPILKVYTKCPGSFPNIQYRILSLLRISCRSERNERKAIFTSGFEYSTFKMLAGRRITAVSCWKKWDIQAGQHWQHFGQFPMVAMSRG